MIRPRVSPLVLLALLSLVASCTDAALADLDRGDAASVPVGDVSAGGDASPGDASVPREDVVAIDAVAPRPDVVSAPDVTAAPDVVAPRPDVVSAPDVPRPPTDLPLVCETCTAFAPVTFCAGTGSGACLAYAGCRDGCLACVPAAVAGDTCASAPVIATTGRSRTVLTTCGAADNLNAGCNRTGPDIAFVLRVARAGRVVGRLTVPEGVGVVFGYDRIGGACRADSLTRTCNNATPQRTQGFDLTLAAGDYTLYAVTTAPSTVVVETELP